MLPAPIRSGCFVLNAMLRHVHHRLRLFRREPCELLRYLTMARASAGSERETVQTNHPLDGFFPAFGSGAIHEMRLKFPLSSLAWQLAHLEMMRASVTGMPSSGASVARRRVRRRGLRLCPGQEPRARKGAGRRRPQSRPGEISSPADRRQDRQRSGT